MIKNKCLSLLCAAVLTLAAHMAQAQKDAALVTTVAGESTWQGASGKAATVQSFMKLREGDRADIKAKAKLNLVYLESGEVEQWDGPASFVIGGARTQNITAGKPVTRKLPMSMVERIARAPEVMTDIRNRSGMTVTRSFVKSEAAERARKIYAENRALLPPEDITPELDLFIVLYKERQYAQARTVLQDMQKRAPDDSVVKELVERFNRSLDAPKPG